MDVLNTGTKNTQRKMHLGMLFPTARLFSIALFGLLTGTNEGVTIAALYSDPSLKVFWKQVFNGTIFTGPYYFSSANSVQYGQTIYIEPCSNYCCGYGGNLSAIGND